MFAHNSTGNRIVPWKVSTDQTQEEWKLREAIMLTLVTTPTSQVTREWSEYTTVRLEWVSS